MTGPKLELSSIDLFPSERWAMKTAPKPSMMVSANKRRGKILKLGMESTLEVLVISTSERSLAVVTLTYGSSYEPVLSCCWREIVLLRQVLYIARAIQRCYISISRWMTRRSPLDRELASV